MREMRLTGLTSNYLGMLVPARTGISWRMHSPTGAQGYQVEGFYVPLDAHLAEDIHILDGYFLNRPLGDLGYYDPKIVAQFLQVNSQLAFEPIQGHCAWPLQDGWIPMVCTMDPGNPLYMTLYDTPVILVYPITK